MSLPTKIINVRLGPQQAEQFKRLKNEFAGLPQATVLRLLISAVLEMPLERQVEVLTKQIRRPAADKELHPEKSRINSSSPRSL